MTPPPAAIDSLSGHAREAAAQIVRSGYIASGMRLTVEDEKVFASFIAGRIDFQAVVEYFSARAS